MGWVDDPPAATFPVTCPACGTQVEVPVWVTGIGTVGLTLREVFTQAVPRDHKCRPRNLKAAR